MFPQLQQVTALLVAQAENGGGGGGFLSSPLIIFPLFFAIFYFVYIRPTGQDRKRHEQLMQNLKRGDEIVLQSGIIGKVADISEKTIHLELGRNIKLEVLKTAVARRKADLNLSESKSDKDEGGKASKK